MSSTPNKTLSEIATNPDACSLKRAAWAYGCAKKGSDIEAALLDVLVRKVRQ